MATETNNNTIPREVMADLQAVADALADGKKLDPEVARLVRERADKARQELLAVRGVQDIGVEIIREIRGDSAEP